MAHRRAAAGLLDSGDAAVGVVVQAASLLLESGPAAPKRSVPRLPLRCSRTVRRTKTAQKYVVLVWSQCSSRPFDLLQRALDVDHSDRVWLIRTSSIGDYLPGWSSQATAPTEACETAS